MRCLTFLTPRNYNKWFCSCLAFRSIYASTFVLSSSLGAGLLLREFMVLRGPLNEISQGQVSVSGFLLLSCITLYLLLSFLPRGQREGGVLEGTGATKRKHGIWFALPFPLSCLLALPTRTGAGQRGNGTAVTKGDAFALPCPTKAPNSG